MSFYRRSRHLVYSDHDVRMMNAGPDATDPHAAEGKLRLQQPRVAPPPGIPNVRRGKPDRPSLPPPDVAARRKAEPANIVLPVTRQWVAHLPGPLYPSALLLRYPRVANQLASGWKDFAGCMILLESLLVDQRGDRLGFPEDVYDELLALHEYFVALKEGAESGIVRWHG